MGRFVTRDPQGLLGSNFLAMYSYATDNPLAELDPTGQDPFSDAFGAAYAAGFGLGFLSGFAGALVPDSAAAAASDASMVGSGASTISTFQATAPSALQTLAGYLSAAVFVYR